MGAVGNYFRSDDFKRLSRNTADSGIKIVFSWLAWGFLGFKNFIIDMFKMAFGMRR